jgi:AmmeMemoRadiSam system protein A
VPAFPIPPEPPSLAEADQRLLGTLAARALLRYCQPSEATEGDETVAIPERLALGVGVFVTLFSGEDLRGCLGSAEGREPLHDSVPRLTVASASCDPRFPRVRLEELPRMRIEITLLGALTRLPSDEAQLLEGLDPELHGIHIRSGPLSGLYLPQVARRFDWGPRRLLGEVSQKAGLPEGGWRDPAAELFFFRARSFGVPAHSSSPGGVP